MSFSPTPDQALLLFGLLARHGDSAQADLVPSPKVSDRDQLVKARLVDMAKVGRSVHLRLSDAGWAWAGANLSATLPPAHRTLQHLLARLAAHLTASGETLADFIGSAPKAMDAPADAPRPSKVRRGPAKPKPPTAAALRKRIEVAYLTLTTGRRNESVRLALLRRELGDLDRAVVDAGLARILKGDRTASLMRHDDPRQIDAIDREAAFSPAGEPFHLLWIAS